MQTKKKKSSKSGTETQGRRTGFLPQLDVYPPGDKKENPVYAAKNVIKLAKDRKTAKDQITAKPNNSKRPNILAIRISL